MTAGETRQEAIDKTQSVLDSLTAGIVEGKRNRGTKLTPVGTEVRVANAAGEALGRTSAAFPNDHPAEAVLRGVELIREQMAAIEVALQAVEAQLGARVNGEPIVDEVARNKAAEAAADAKHAAAAEAVAVIAEEPVGSETAVAAVARFNAEFAAKARAAQDAVFTPPSGDVAAGWVCPEHGKAIEKTSRKGRKYMACPDCTRFEELA